MQPATRRPAVRALCLLCSFRGIHTPLRRLLLRPPSRPIARRSPAHVPALATRRHQSSEASKTDAPPPTSLYSPEDTKSYDRLFKAINDKLFLQTVGDNPKIPRETEVILAFKALQRLAANYPATTATTSKSQPPKNPKSTPPNDAILTLTGSTNGASNGQKTEKNLPPEPAPQSQETIAAEKEAKLNAPVHPLMDVAYHIAIHPFIFISPKVLTEYIKLAALLKDPSTLPSIFKLYANKPVLHNPSLPPKRPNPNAAKNAIAYDSAKAAVQVAIAAKNMPIALDLIDCSVGARAWCRRKLITQVLPFSAVASAIPLGLYKLSDYLAQFQEQWLHEKAMTYAFLGFMTYYICTGSLGMIALLTWNDHMIRVNWIPGVYMRERWFMEEQRALTDRVAMAWGYQEPFKRGLESGWEWEMLRHWAGVRGMIIDSSEMVEGREMSAEKDAERLAAQESILARMKLKLAKPSDKKAKKQLFST